MIIYMLPNVYIFIFLHILYNFIYILILNNISSTLAPTPTLFNPPNHYNIYFYEQWGKT